jgi:nucleoside-diphosphate-sugar epimerase
LHAASPRNGVYNVCPGSLITFADYLEAARAALPGLLADIKVEAKGGFGGFPLIRQTPSDIRLAKQELGFSCRYSLAETLRHYID